jgi:hypothetical protein
MVVQPVVKPPLHLISQGSPKQVDDDHLVCLSIVSNTLFKVAYVGIWV